MAEPRSFLCAPGLRIESQERLSELRFNQLNENLAKFEAIVDRLERRLWLIVYGVAGAILAETLLTILEAVR